MKKQAGVLAVAVVAAVIGAVAAGFIPGVRGQDTTVKKPLWQYGLSFRVRQAAEADFGPNTKKIGLEVYKDDNNGNLIYVSETGSIAVVPGK
jgi:hypothetical protein